MNKLFANTRDSFSTAEKNAAGKKRVVSATTLARAIYRFATAPTNEAAIAHHAVIEVLLKHCSVTVSDQKDDLTAAGAAQLEEFPDWDGPHAPGTSSVPRPYSDMDIPRISIFRYGYPYSGHGYPYSGHGYPIFGHGYSKG